MAGARVVPDIHSALAPWVLVAGGFHSSGGMDRLNAALARHLVGRGNTVHLVCHRADAEFLGKESVVVHRVPKFAGSFMLGGLLLALEARKVARQVTLQSPQARVVVNGGNCNWPDINWVHYVHSAWHDDGGAAPPWFKLKNRSSKWLSCWREGAAVRRAKLIIANSQRTCQDLIDYLGVDPARIQVVYPAVDADFLLRALPVALRLAHGWGRMRRDLWWFSLAALVTTRVRGLMCSSRPGGICALSLIGTRT